MSYLKYDSTIKVKDGYFCFHTITEFRGVNWREIEEANQIADLSLNSNIFVLNSNDEFLEVNKIKYYGINKLTKIIFENNNEIIVHKNQLFYLIKDLGEDPIFTKVVDLKIGDTISTRESSLRIKQIIIDFEENHTYGLIFDPPNENSIHYIQYDIVVK